jgi:hypothetical protein
VAQTENQHFSLWVRQLIIIKGGRVRQLIIIKNGSNPEQNSRGLQI